MSAFTNGFNFGFVQGMFNRMFCGFSTFGGGCDFSYFNGFGGNFIPYWDISYGANQLNSCFLPQTYSTPAFTINSPSSVFTTGGFNNFTMPQMNFNAMNLGMNYNFGNFAMPQFSIGDNFTQTINKNDGGEKIDIKSLGITQEGIDLIKKNEGLTLKAEWDVNGYAIGYGHHGSDITKNTTITKEQAEEYLKQDLKKYIANLKQYVKVPLSQHQFDACISLMYNIGAGGFKNSDVCKLLNAGKYSEAADAFLKYNHSRDKKGKLVVLDGLTKRRKEEKALFLKA